MNLHFDEEPGPSANDDTNKAWSPLRESPGRRNAFRSSLDKFDSTDKFASTEKFESFPNDQSGVKNYEGVQV